MTSAVDPRLRESFCPAELEDPNKAWTITAEGQPPPTEAGGNPRAAEWDEIEDLFSSHLERFDSLYRRLA